MKRFIEGESREQFTFLPEFLDDCIGEDNLVRVITMAPADQDTFFDKQRAVGRSW